MTETKISNKTRAVLVGVLILVAYGVLISGITDSRVVVMIADLISGLSVIGIAALLYPLFKNEYKKLSLAYLSLKIAEGGLMIFAGVLILHPDLAYMKDIIYKTLHLYFFIAGGFMLYFLLFKTQLVPKFISIWGAAGIFALFISTALALFGISHPVLEAFLLLIITNEVFLAIWLMVKGFKIKAQA
jgi:hypothetical protein